MTAKNPESSVNPADLYVRGVEWIALNDEPTALDASEITGQVSICLLADLLNLSADRVARDVVRVRKALNKDADAVSGKTSKRILSAATDAYKAEIAAADWTVEGGTDRDTSWTKSIGHGVKDSKQREIGNVAVIWEEKGGPTSEHGVTPRPAGFYVRIWSTRDGKHFGAIPRSTRLNTIDEAKQVADGKLLAARQRTVREAAKGNVRGAK